MAGMVESLPVISPAVPEDTITCRPRTPNNQYTLLTDTQVRNIKKDFSPHFHVVPTGNGSQSNSASLAGKVGGRHYVDRYCQVIDSGMLRGYSGHSHMGWIDQKHSRFPDERYNTSRALASVKWGPNKAGERTRSHYYGETVDRYTTIDMYRRNPTNYPGRVVMDHGRPGDGYYAQKYPNRTTYFGSSVPLNRSHIMTSVYPKTLAQYQAIDSAERTARQARTGAWPEYSEYTDKYLLRTQSEVKLSQLEEKKKRLLEAAA